MMNLKRIFTRINLPALAAALAGLVSCAREAVDVIGTESILGVFTALPAGYLKIIKVKVLDNGAVQTSDPLVGVSVTLDWEPGQEYVVPF